MTKDDALKQLTGVNKMTKLDINTALTHAIGLDVNGNEVIVKLITPLYTHPVQKPLSDEEIEYMWEILGDIHNFARAIEKHHGIKHD